jgi:hypothetical protein
MSGAQEAERLKQAERWLDTISGAAFRIHHEASVIMEMVADDSLWSVCDWPEMADRMAALQADYLALQTALWHAQHGPRYWAESDAREAMRRSIGLNDPA